jgi:hypothetical protein
VVGVGILESLRLLDTNPQKKNHSGQTQIIGAAHQQTFFGLV